MLWPQPTSTSALIEVTRRNVAAVVATYVEQGIESVRAQRRHGRAPTERSVDRGGDPRGRHHLCATLRRSRHREDRLRQREIGTGFERDLESSTSVAAYIEANDDPDQITVSTDGRTVVEVAEEVLRTSTWLSCTHHRVMESGNRQETPHLPGRGDQIRCGPALDRGLPSTGDPALADVIVHPTWIMVSPQR